MADAARVMVLAKGPLSEGSTYYAQGGVSAVLAELAPLFTAGKWLALSASFMLLGIGVIIALTARWRARSSRPPRS